MKGDMRRADRLFRIVQLLRTRRLTTAAWLARELEVSQRTIYRDVHALGLSGVPIEGEAGVGYRLRGFDLPPLMFDEREIEALVLGARFVRSWSDPELARAATQALSKVESALPERLRPRLDDISLFAPRYGNEQPVAEQLRPLRAAIVERRRVRFSYRREDGKRSARTVRPVGLFFWGYNWTLVAWCELRDDFRSFRLDRMTSPRRLESGFEPEPGKRLVDYFERINEDQA